MRKLLYILFVYTMVCCLVFSCKTSNSEKENLPTVLIFEKAPSQLTAEFGEIKLSSIKPAEIAFVDNNGLVQYFSPNREQDTLTIFSSADHIEICHLYKALEYLYFYIKSGDTVLLTYDENKYPTLKSYTSDQLTQQYNFLKNISGRLSYFGFNPLSLLKESNFWRIYRRKEKSEFVPKALMLLYMPMDTVVQQASIYLQNYTSLLEKQQNEKKISSDVYDFYKYLLQTKIIEKRRNLLLNNPTNLQQPALDTLNQIYDGYFNDEHCRYVSYLHSIDGYLFAYMNFAKIPVINKNNVGSGSSYPDYRTVFDNISTRKDIPSKTHSYILFGLLDDIVTNFLLEDIKHYEEKYINLTGDSIKSKNKLLERGITEIKNEDIQLRDEKGNELNFKELKKQLYGKVIYLDFWASWCSPCREVMLEAFKLRKEYENKDVVFLYLAFNDREEEWKKAINQLQLNDDHAINYFIVNSKSSETIQKLKVASIPRYLLYDKTGEVVHFNAPAPYDKKIRELINQVLKE